MAIIKKFEIIRKKKFELFRKLFALSVRYIARRILHLYFIFCKIFYLCNNRPAELLISRIINFRCLNVYE